MSAPETTGVDESTSPIRSTALAPMRMQGFALAPTTFDEAWRMAQILAKTEFAPKDMRGKPEAIIAALAMGNEVGLSPMQALQSIAVINGRPSLWGDGMLGVVRRDPSFVKLEETTTGSIKDETMVARCVLHRKNPSGDVIETPGEFSVEDAQTAKLWGKDSPWRTYPKRMLQMRARAFALRDGASDLLRGMQSAEEQFDVVGEPAPPSGPVVTVEGEVLPPINEEDVDKIATLAKNLKWTAARVEVERKSVGFDDAKLLERMEAEAARGGKKRPQPEPVIAEGIVCTEKAIEQTITKATNAALFASLSEVGIETKPVRIAFAKDHGVDVDSYSDLTEAQGRKLIDAVHKYAAEIQQAAVRADGRKVNETMIPCPACECAPGQPHFANCPEIT